MRFAFTPEQHAFRAAVRDLLAAACPPDAVRAGTFSQERWTQLARTGAIGVLADATEADLVPVLEECGRAAVPEPLADVAAVALPLLRDAGDADGVARIAAGDAIAAVGLEPGAPVADADVADLLLLASLDGGVRLLARDEVKAAPLHGLAGTRRLFTVRHEPGAGRALAGGDHARALLDAAFDRGAFAAAAVLCGLADRMIEMAASYASQRVQFGKPIGSFQAVKHLLADALLGLEFARPAVYRAAWSIARGSPERARDVSMAKAMATEAALGAARASLQVHGGIGYTEELDLHLWMKRAWGLAPAYGDAAWHRARLARAVL